MGYKMNVETIYKRAYALMDQSVIDSNCGALCNYHCCRPIDDQGNGMGMYLLPYEYKYLKMKNGLDGMALERHTNDAFELPEGVEQMFYMFCDEENCNRVLRPIQCRTYPFEAHLIDGQLYLVIEKMQVHNCPLLVMKDKWRREFIAGVYEGWALLLSVPNIRHYIQGESRIREQEGNIQALYDHKMIRRMIDGKK